MRQLLLKLGMGLLRHAGGRSSPGTGTAALGSLTMDCLSVGMAGLDTAQTNILQGVHSCSCMTADSWQHAQQAKASTCVAECSNNSWQHMASSCPCRMASATVGHSGRMLRCGRWQAAHLDQRCSTHIRARFCWSEGCLPDQVHLSVF